MSLPTLVNALTSDSVSGTTVTGTVPAGVAEGDILLSWVAFGGTNGFTASTNGGTKIGEYYRIQSGIITRLTVALFWLRVPASVPSTMVYTQSASGAASAVGIVAVRGCITSGTPYDFVTESADAGALTSILIPAMDTTSYGADRLLVDGHIWVGYAEAVASNPVRYTNQGDVGMGSSSDLHSAVFTRNRATAASESADSGTISNNQWKLGLNLSMKPQPSGYLNDVIGVSAANIGKVNGVATANISAVNGI